MNNNISVFIAACAGMLLFGISLITLGSVATNLQSKFWLDGVGSGTLFSILPFGILTGSLIFGPVCDRYGYKLLLITACISMFIGFEGIAYTESHRLLKLCIFIFGVGGGIINGTTNAVVSHISENNKGADLSLLGVFFGIGALGIPLVLGMLWGITKPLDVVAIVGWLTLLVGLFYIFIKFPAPKLKQQSESVKWKTLINSLLLFIAFFLFFQSSLEALMNNWATTYLTTRGIMSNDEALFALSLHIVGMVIMRLLTGSVFRKVSQIKIMWISLFFLAAGIALIQFGETKFVVTAGLILSGAGLAGGFPLMLGFVGERFSQLSGTAFSFVFVIALIGNMLINYLMGIIVHEYGVHNLILVSYIEISAMAILFLFIIIKLK